MAKIGRICKESMVKELTDKLKNSSTIFVTDCTGLSVSDLGKLRSRLKPSKISYMVVKNSLAVRALKNAKDDDLVPLIDGTIGVVLGATDPIIASKVLLTFSKELGKLKVKGAILDGKLISEAQIKELSLLPPKEVILAMVFGGMKAPISGFVVALEEIVKKFAYAINAIKGKKETAEGGVK